MEFELGRSEEYHLESCFGIINGMSDSTVWRKYSQLILEFS